MKLIGREKEQEILRQRHASGNPEFVAVYGRRRVGKTFLVKTFFEGKFDFYVTGLYDKSKKEQLACFAQAMTASFGVAVPTPATWIDAFTQLSNLLMTRRKQRWVVFIDELPWFDTPKSGFMAALEWFWNSWGSTQKRLMLVVCGSATTWMMSNLIVSHGGLHNRLTQSIYLHPFTLGETEQYIRHVKQMSMSRYETLQCYMALGGTPYYLSLLQSGQSATQNIDRLFFAAHGALRLEYDFLFRSLFRDAELYERIVELLSTKAMGLTRRDIQQQLNVPSGGTLTRALENLISCDFIRRYEAFGKSQRDALYQLTDLYTLFYLKFVKNYHSRDEQRWSHMLDNPSRVAWSGYAFEMVCLHHLPQIKRALGIDGILTEVSSWVYRGDEGGAQIDLIIDRRDQVINLCEMKFSVASYALSEKYYNHMVERQELFRRVTRTRKALHLTMITTHGLTPGPQANLIASQVTMDDLFA